MNVFDFLKDAETRISQSLDDCYKNYSVWPRDRVFEETKKILAELKHHFDKESIVVNNLKNNGAIKEIISKAQKDRDEIVSEVSSLIMIHVDEPGFEQGLESIDKKFQNYRQYCSSNFYPKVKEQLSAVDLKHVNDQLGQLVLD